MKKILFGLKLILMGLLVAFAPCAESATITRSVAGTRVTLDVRPDAGTGVYAVEDSLPAGITPDGTSDNGFWDAHRRKVKWGPFFDNQARLLSYTVTGNPGTYALTGAGGFGSTAVTAGGDSVLTLSSAAPLGRVTRTAVGKRISLVAEPGASVLVYLVDEYLPAGLTPSNISHGGTWNGAIRLLRWGPFVDHTPRALTYEVECAAGAYVFSGMGSFDGVSYQTSGDNPLAIVLDPYLTWRELMFGVSAPDTIAGPAADPDGDGMNNEGEFVSGTNPTNRLDYLHLLAPGVLPLDDQVVVRWTSASNRTYTLEQSTNLLLGFNAVLAEGLSATPPMNLYTNTGGLPPAARFYRVKVTAPAN